MKKRKFVIGLLLVLSIFSFVNFESQVKTTVYATKSSRKSIDSKNKEKIEKKIKIHKRLFDTLASRRIRLKEFQDSLTNGYYLWKNKSLKNFQNDLIGNLVNDLNQNISNTSYIKYILKCFGCEDSLINLIFKKENKSQTVVLKFKKINCCPEMMIQVTKNFSSKEEKSKFKEALYELISNEESIGKRIFSGINDNYDTYNLILILMK